MASPGLIWVHARYNWHSGDGPADGYWRLQVPTKNYVTTSSDCDQLLNVWSRMFSFPCIIVEGKFKFNLPSTRQEIDWKNKVDEDI